ncbi:MAG: GNAT family N-acetyltransferase [Christiangramia sp.]|uniref:GNAT family N-acetyltransferase n=1 Tax=Christiangramia sp. TaxID=1931228 RepID=UPI003242AC08
MAASYVTPRLVLRPTDEQDAEFFFELLNSPKWLANIGDRQVYSVETAERYIAERIVAQREKFGYASFTLLRREDSVKIGVCGLYRRDGLQLVDLGFALLPKYEGFGYAFEACQELIQKASEDFKIEELAAITLPQNVASRKLLEKLGFQFEKFFHLPNDETELCYYLK